MASNLDGNRANLDPYRAKNRVINAMRLLWHTQALSQGQAFCEGVFQLRALKLSQDDLQKALADLVCELGITETENMFQLEELSKPANWSET